MVAAATVSDVSAPPVAVAKAVLRRFPVTTGAATKADATALLEEGPAVDEATIDRSFSRRFKRDAFVPFVSILSFAHSTLSSAAVAKVLRRVKAFNKY